MADLTDAEIAELRRLRAWLTRDQGNLIAESRFLAMSTWALPRLLDELERRRGALQDELQPLREENARLRLAMQPFADNCGFDDSWNGEDYVGYRNLQIKHFRAAVAALGDAQEGRG